MVLTKLLSQYPFLSCTRQYRQDEYGEVAIVSHRSMNCRRIVLNDNFNHILERFSIDLVGVEVEISNRKFEFWSIYIPPSANRCSDIINYIYSFATRLSIIGGDFNGYYPAW